MVIRTALQAWHLLRTRALRAAGARPAWWARLLRLVLDPGRSDSTALLVGLVILLGSMWVFLGVLEDVASGDPLVMVDLAVFTFLQHLRTQPMDGLMERLTQLGSVGVMLPLIAAVAAWLAWRRCWRTVGYWLATAASAEAVIKVLKQTLGRSRPLAMYQGAEQYSFPSGHATMSAVVLAFLAFLLTRGQSARWQVAICAAAALYVGLVGFSRLYLGAHWMSDVFGGFSFGLAAASLSAAVYSGHRVREDVQPQRLALLAAATIAIAAGVGGGAFLPL